MLMNGWKGVVMMMVVMVVVVVVDGGVCVFEMDENGF